MYRDPSEFRARFKAYKDGKSVREIYGLPGYSRGKFDEATKKKIDYYYKLLRNNGFDMMSAVGILGNMMLESSFNPNVVNHLGYHGLLLNSKAIQQAIKNQYGDLSEQSLLRYLSDWTDGATWIRKGPYASDTALYSKSYLRSGYKTPELAAFEFLKRYERAIVVDPKTKKALRDANGNYVYQDKDKRLGYAKSIYNYLAGLPDGIQELITQVGKTQPEPIIAVPDATRVATTIPQEKIIPIADPRNATIAEALRAIWAHTAFENMPKISDMPIWESPSLPALTPVEYDVTPLKTYAGGKVADEPVITQGRAGSRLEKFRRSMDPDELGKALDKDFKNMSDEEYKEYMSNGYFRDIMLNILSDLDAQKKFMSKLKNGKLPSYEDGLASKLKNFVKNIFVQRDEKEDKKVQEDISNLAKIGSHSMQRVLQRSPDFAIPAAVDFVLTYYNSPGFAERLQKMKNNISEYANSKYNAGATEYSEYNKGNLKLGSITLNHKLDENAEYNHGTGNITYGDLNGKQLKNEYGAVIAHELGHAIDSSMGIDGRGFPSYSNTILPFRRGFLYRINEKWLEENSNKKAVEDWRKYPEEFPYELHHDRMPFEYYADLIAFRYWLLLAGIYDSTKANNPFTREHLDKLYHDSIFGKFEDRPLPVRRFMTEFDWDDIVKIMNDVAYVDKTNNGVLYAANGKLPSYSKGKISIKPSKRGTFTAAAKKHGASVREFESRVLKNPEKYSKAMVKKARFSRNARSWKH